MPCSWHLSVLPLTTNWTSTWATALTYSLPEITCLFMWFCHLILIHRQVPLISNISGICGTVSSGVKPQGNVLSEMWGSCWLIKWPTHMSFHMEPNSIRDCKRCWGVGSTRPATCHHKKWKQSTRKGTFQLMNAVKCSSLILHLRFSFVKASVYTGLIRSLRWRFY